MDEGLEDEGLAHGVRLAAAIAILTPESIQFNRFLKLIFLETSHF